MIVKSYGLVGDADGHSQRVHRPYLSLTTSRFVVLLPSTYDNHLIKIYTYKFDIQERHVSQSQRGGKFNRLVQGRGSTCRFGARSEGGQRVRSINRIASQSSHRYSRGGHDTIVLHSFQQLLTLTDCETIFLNTENLHSVCLC